MKRSTERILTTVWARLAALTEGARLTSAQLWRTR